MQAMPNLETLKKVIPDSAMNFNSPQFKNHQKHPTGFETLNHYLKEYLVIPGNMEDYAYATQILQAYALTTGIEAQRRATPYCMGSLIWQLNDCWPVTSWSLVDYELKKKIAYQEVNQAFQNLIISVKEEADYYQIYIINDSLKNLKNYTLHVDISDFYGKKIIEKKLQVNIPAQSSKVYFSLKKKSLVGVDLTTIYMHMYFDPTWTYAYNFFHFVELNKLKLPQPNFSFEQIGNRDFYKVTSNVYTPYTLIDNTWYRDCLVPGEGTYINVERKYKGYIDNLRLHPEKIKCLNSLLNLNK
jgi:beta-mannosidase